MTRTPHPLTPVAAATGIGFRAPVRAVLAGAVCALGALAGCTQSSEQSSVEVTQQAAVDAISRAPFRVPPTNAENYGFTQTLATGDAAESSLDPLLSLSSDSTVPLAGNRTLTAEQHPRTPDYAVLKVTGAPPSQTDPSQTDPGQTDPSQTTPPGPPDPSNAAQTSGTSGASTTESPAGITGSVDPSQSTVSAAVGRRELETFTTMVKTAAASARAQGLFTQPTTISLDAVSAAGGTVRFEYACSASPSGELIQSMKVGAATPPTGTDRGRTNTPATAGVAYSQLTVEITTNTSRDEFEYFANRAVGRGGAPVPAIEDFEIPSHPWLHVSIGSNVTDQSITTTLQGVSRDGVRYELGRATSTVADSIRFVDSTLNLVDSALTGFPPAAPDAVSGDVETPAWTAPFTATDTAQPAGATAATLQATLSAGVGPDLELTLRGSTIYDLLDDVEYTASSTDAEFEPAPQSPTACGELGSIDAGGGRFVLTFALAPGLAKALSGVDIIGTVYGAQYEGADVVGGQPRPGAAALGVFAINDVNLTSGTSDPNPLESLGSAGPYQFFGFLDANGNANPTNPQADAGDLVLRPISPYTLRCDEQPISLEFAYRQR